MKRWNVIASALLCSLFSVGCIPGANNTTPASYVRNTGTDVARIINTSYDANTKTVTLYTQTGGTKSGEDAVDISNSQGIINYATALYPSRTIQSVQVVRQGRAQSPAAGFAGQSIASASQFVETRGGYVSYHTAPRLRSSIAGRLRTGQKALLVGRPNAFWYEIQVNGRNVYITTNSRFTRVVSGPTATTPPKIGTPIAPTPAPAPTPTPSPVTTTTVPPSVSPAPSVPTLPPSQTSIPLPPPGVHMDNSIAAAAGLSTSRTQKANAVLQVATSKLGTPYVWGHNEDRGQYGFDCSNFTEYVYHHALGYLFTSWSRGQYTSVGVPVPIAQMQPGDLLIFNSGGHVGIYAGNGQMIQEGGGLAKVGYLKVSPGTYWGTHISAVKRMF